MLSPYSTVVGFTVGFSVEQNLIMMIPWFPDQGSNPGPGQLRVPSTHHWTAREVAAALFLTDVPAWPPPLIAQCDHVDQGCADCAGALHHSPLSLWAHHTRVAPGTWIHHALMAKPSSCLCGLTRPFCGEHCIPDSRFCVLQSQ